jgi:antitoxin HicB
MFYPVEFEDDEGMVIVTIPDLPGTHDCGVSREEAMVRVRGAALAIIQSLIDDRQDIPDPSPLEGRPIIALPSQAWTKVLLYRALRESDWRKADLARALGVDQKSVDRLLNLHHASRWDQVDDAFRAMGKAFVPEMRDVA